MRGAKRNKRITKTPSNSKIPRRVSPVRGSRNEYGKLPRRVRMSVRTRALVYVCWGRGGRRERRKKGYLFSFRPPCPVETAAAAAVAMTTRDTRFAAGRKDLG